MSQAQYTAIQKARLIDLPNLPAGQVFQWLETKPEWLQINIKKYLTRVI